MTDRQTNQRRVMTREEWLDRELQKAPPRNEEWRRRVMKLWGLKDPSDPS